MSHLGERVAEYVVGEMTDSEAAEALEHLRQCPACTEQVEGVQRTLSMLQAVPDKDPPRPIVFEATRRNQSLSWLWRWASPAIAAVTASILTAMLMSPARVEPPRIVQQPLVESTPQNVDTQRIAEEVQAASRSWLAAELDKRDRVHDQNLERLRGEVAYWESQQRVAVRETLNTARSIQLLATKLPPGE